MVVEEVSVCNTEAAARRGVAQHAHEGDVVAVHDGLLVIRQLEPHLVERKYTELFCPVEYGQPIGLVSRSPQEVSRVACVKTGREMRTLNAQYQALV